MPENKTFPCPKCATTLPADAARCYRCEIRLTGPDAARLWEVNQQIATLRTEADFLLARLQQPELAAATVAAAPAQPHVSTPLAEPYPSPAPAAVAPAPRKSLSGQQILLSIGALLLLSACAFFLYVVWTVLGIVGQACIMVALTGTAVAASALATSRRLPAAAETAAVIATGLLLLDLSAAHSLGLAGLDRVEPNRYWLAASLLAGALLLGWDRLMPTTRQGQPLRGVLTYRPAAAIALTTTPWILLSLLDYENTALTILFALVAATNAGTAYAFHRTAPAGGPVAATVGNQIITIPATIPALGTVFAGLGYLGTGFATAYNLDSATLTTLDRYLAAFLMALGPLSLTVASTRITRRFLTPTRRATLPLIAVVWSLPVLGVPLLDAPWPVFVALAVVTAGYVAVADAQRLPSPTTKVRIAWAQLLHYLAYTAQPTLYLLTVVLAGSGYTTLARGITHPETATTPGQAAFLWASVPAFLWALSASHGAARHRHAGYVAAAEIGLYVGLATAMHNAGHGTWTLVMLAGFAANVALASYAAHHTPRPAAADETIPKPENFTGFGGPRFWLGTDLCAVLFGVLYAISAVATTFEESSATRCALTLITIGVLTLIYAASPHRLPMAYLGSLAISAGTALLSWKAGATAMEVYTGPLVILLALIGFVQWHRNHDAPTVVTMGPALSVAMGPTLLAGLAGDQTRLVAVTFSAIVFLVVGLSAQWKAPVTTSSLVLIVVAVTQGGPLVDYVPGWVLLGGAGASLLTVGVAWERAVLAGRRANAWYGSLA